jgi:hypothetical protein
VALVLCVLLGWLGGHRFYVGKRGTAVLQACTFAGVGLWWLYDFILLVSGAFRDKQDRRVVSWSEGEAAAAHLPPGFDQKLQVVLEELDLSRAEMAELAERVDFLERMLTQVKGRAGLPGRTS